MISLTLVTIGQVDDGLWSKAAGGYVHEGHHGVRWFVLCVIPPKLYQWQAPALTGKHLAEVWPPKHSSRSCFPRRGLKQCCPERLSRSSCCTKVALLVHFYMLCRGSWAIEHENKSNSEGLGLVDCEGRCKQNMSASCTVQFAQSTNTRMRWRWCGGSNNNNHSGTSSSSVGMIVLIVVCRII